MKYLSLFTGIGGFELGIQQAYVALHDRKKNRQSKSDPSLDAEKRQGLVATSGEDACTPDGHHSELPNRINDDGAPVSVGYSEIDKYAIQIYQKHFPNHTNYGDITKISAGSLPDFDLLVGGFPCQSFSIAGKRRGFEDVRGTLFFEICRIITEKRPRLLLLENVKGLLSHDQGQTFATIIATLDELGYDLQWQVLNSKDFGVPQNRERVFIVGHLRGSARPEVFPFRENDRLSDRKDEPNGGRPQTKHSGTVRGSNIKADGTFIKENIVVPTLRASDYKRGDNQTVVGTLRTHKDGNGFREVKSGVAPTLPARAREDGSGQPVLYQGMSIRRLTPKECERLQGFPDDWTNEVSDTQRYKTCGNAVTVNVIQAIMEKLL